MITYYLDDIGENPDCPPYKYDQYPFALFIDKCSNFLYQLWMTDDEFYFHNW